MMRSNWDESDNNEITNRCLNISKITSSKRLGEWKIHTMMKLKRIHESFLNKIWKAIETESDETLKQQKCSWKEIEK